jgi:hypothetical protein
MIFKKLLFVGSMLIGMPLCAQNEPMSDLQTRYSQVLESLTFDDVAYILMYLRFSALHEKKELEMGIISDLLHDEQNAILMRNNIKLPPVDAYYADREFVTPEWRDNSIRSHAVRDLYTIVLYRLIYKMTYEKIIQHDPNSEEMLLFKNMLTPRAFDEAYHWIQVGSNPATISMFPLSIQEKVLAFVKQLSFDEAVTWLIAGTLLLKYERGIRFQVTGEMWASSTDGAVLLNQKMRQLIEQQELPERRALARFLWTDQEITNLRTNGEFLSKGLAMSSKSVGK